MGNAASAFISEPWVPGRFAATPGCFAILMLAAGCAAPAAGGPEGSDEAICEDAHDVIESCTGGRPEASAEGCLGSYRSSAEDVVAGGCDALYTSDGKADSGGFWCLPFN